MPEYLFWLLIPLPLPAFSVNKHLGEKEHALRICGAQKTATEMGESGQRKDGLTRDLYKRSEQHSSEGKSLNKRHRKTNGGGMSLAVNWKYPLGSEWS